MLFLFVAMSTFFLCHFTCIEKLPKVEIDEYSYIGLSLKALGSTGGVENGWGYSGMKDELEGNVWVEERYLGWIW